MRAASVFALLFLYVVVEVNSQYPHIRFMGNLLPDNSFVNVSQLGGGAYSHDILTCHTDMDTCCSRYQGYDRGDWYDPIGNRLPFPDNRHHLVQSRQDRHVELRFEWDDGNTKLAAVISGIYCCKIETWAVNSFDMDDLTARSSVCVGLYNGSFSHTGEVSCFRLCVCMCAL